MKKVFITSRPGSTNVDNAPALNQKSNYDDMMIN